jgi:hypothetical protein
VVSGCLIGFSLCKEENQKKEEEKKNRKERDVRVSIRVSLVLGLV